MSDPYLDAMLDRLEGFNPAEVVLLTSNGKTVKALYDDGDLPDSDSFGQRVLLGGIGLRYRDGAITTPADGATVTATGGQLTGTVTFTVRESRRDPQNPGMRLLVVV